MANELTEKKPTNVAALLGAQSTQLTIRNAVMKGVDPEWVIKMGVVACKRNQDLLKCTPDSFMLSILDAAQCGLDCSGANGEGYIVPFGNTATFIPGYKGFIKAMTRDRIVLAVDAYVVYANEHFDPQYGTDPRIVHVPSMGKQSDEDIVAAYAVATLPTGQKKFEVLRRDELDHIRRVAKSKNIWNEWFGAQCKKSAIRRLHKTIGASSKTVERLEELDNRQYELSNAQSKPFSLSDWTIPKATPEMPHYAQETTPEDAPPPTSEGKDPDPWGEDLPKMHQKKVDAELLTSPPPEPTIEDEELPEGHLSAAQVKRAFAIGKATGLESKILSERVRAQYGMPITHIHWNKYKALIEWIEAGAPVEEDMP